MSTTAVQHAATEQRAHATGGADLPGGRRAWLNSPLTVETVPAAELAAGQVRVRVEASGLCHTDIHAAHGDAPGFRAPTAARQ